MTKILLLLMFVLTYVGYAQRLPNPSGNSAPRPSNSAVVDANATTPRLPASPPILGNPFVDASTLVTQIRSNNIDQVIYILYFYARQSNPNATFESATIENLVNGNNFLKQLLNNRLQQIRDYFVANKTTLTAKVNELNQSGSTIHGVLESIFPANRVVDGLGTFLAERFKEELTQRYLQAFRDSLITKNEKFHYSILLPKTYQGLVEYENIFEYKSFMTALKEAFKDDLDNLAGNSLKFVDTLHSRKLFAVNDQQYYLAYYVASFAVNELPGGTSPVALFNNFEQYRYKDKVHADVRGIFAAVSAFAINLNNNTGGEATSANINTLLRDVDVLNAFCGLVIEKEKLKLTTLTIGNVSVYSWLNGKSNVEVAPLITRLGNLRRSTEAFVNSERSFDDVIALATKVTPEVRQLLKDTKVVDNTSAEFVFGIIDHVVNLANYAADQKYGLVITEALALFTDLNLDSTVFYKNFKKYGLFISNVAQAETSEQVQAALEIAALPVGSYKIKRNALTDISLNAYPGVFAGVELAGDLPSGITSDQVKEQSAVFGFTAPVGLAFSWGGRATKDDTDSTENVNEFRVLRKADGRTVKQVSYVNGRSHSLFISIIDIGAVTSFRLADDETETLPEFTWNNILAPGISYIKGMKDTPLSWGLGLQYGPQLRSIDETDITLSGSMISIRAFLAVDIPIFNFFTRTTPR